MKHLFICGSAFLFFIGLATPSHGQGLQAAGVSGTFNVARLRTGQPAFQLGSVTLDPLADQSNDETGNGVTLFGRWQVGRGGWYAQPELGYVSTLETPVRVTHSRGDFPYAGRRIRHLDARLLAGYQAGPLRLFAGPGVGYFLRNAVNPDFSSDYPDPEVRAVLAALDVPPPRLQASVQVGAGVSLWRLDLNARYEWGLTQYSRTITWQQESFYLNRNLQQLILEVGFQLYKRPAQL